MPRRKLDLDLGAGRRLSCLEWPGAPGVKTVALIAADRQPLAWDEFASKLAGERRVVALPPEGGANLSATLRAVGGPPVLVAHGQAGRAACSVAASDPGHLSALVLADYAPAAGSAEPRRLTVPTLILRGRQSTLLDHASAVALHQAMPGSRLIEPEDCGAWPFGSCPEAAATAVRWFVSELAASFMEFVVPEAGEPVDPQAARKAPRP